MTLSRGIDVSHHQGNINWPKITAELGLTWGACKATEGNGFRDDQFDRNWAAMKAAGLVRIAYHFGRPGSGATAQANYFLSVVKPVAGDVLCLDLETADGHSQRQVNAWAKEFAAVLRRGAPGNTTVVYLGGYAANGTGSGLCKDFDYWWYPRYATMSPVSQWPGGFTPRLSGNTTGWKTPHVWQWACSLRTSEGQVDANLSTLSAAELRDGPVQEDDMPTADEIAHAVWAYDQDGKKRQAWGYLQTAAADQAATIAAAVKAQLPVAGPATTDQLEQAFRNVLGSLDN
jgi:hypothetical protein